MINKITIPSFCSCQQLTTLRKNQREEGGLARVLRL